MFQIRQGDVLVEQISSLPKKLKKQINKEKIILAFGEATGHHHAIEVTDATESFVDEAGILYLNIGKGKHSSGIFKGEILREQDSILNNDGCFFARTEFGDILFDKINFEFHDGKIYAQKGFSVLTHQEHYQQAVTASSYRVTIQKEYTPEAIRNVLD